MYTSTTSFGRLQHDYQGNVGNLESQKVAVLKKRINEHGKDLFPRLQILCEG